MANSDFYSAEGKKIIDNEILQWREKTALIEQEIAFAYEVYESHAAQRQYQITASQLLSEFEALRHKNNEFQEQIVAFMVRTEGITECDDLQCEDYFMSNYQKFRSIIEQHFAAYRKVKLAFLEVAAVNKLLKK